MTPTSSWTSTYTISFGKRRREWPALFMKVSMLTPSVWSCSRLKTRSELNCAWFVIARANKSALASAHKRTVSDSKTSANLSFFIYSSEPFKYLAKRNCRHFWILNLAINMPGSWFAYWSLNGSSKETGRFSSLNFAVSSHRQWKRWTAFLCQDITMLWLFVMLRKFLMKGWGRRRTSRSRLDNNNFPYNSGG